MLCQYDYKSFEGEKNMIMQDGDKDILGNVAKTVMVLTAFMFVIIIAANILA